MVRTKWKGEKVTEEREREKESEGSRTEPNGDDDDRLLAGGGFMTSTPAVRKRERQGPRLSYIPTRGGR